jgi:hypothetical protein
MNDYWVSETNVYKIYAETVDEAKQIWEQHCNGTSSAELPIKLKGVEVDADWEDNE